MVIKNYQVGKLYERRNFITEGSGFEQPFSGAYRYARRHRKTKLLNV